MSLYTYIHNMNLRLTYRIKVDFKSINAGLMCNFYEPSSQYVIHSSFIQGKQTLHTENTQRGGHTGDRKLHDISFLIYFSFSVFCLRHFKHFLQ